MTRPKKIIALGQLPPGAYEAYIPYSAWRAQGRFRHKLRQEADMRKNMLKMLALIAIIYFGIGWLSDILPGYLGNFSTLWINVAVYFYLLIITYPLITAPTNIQIGSEGIRLHWLSFLGLWSTPWISLEYIDFVGVSKFSRGYYKSNAIDLYINKDNVPTHLRRILRLIAPSLWCMSVKNRQILKLRLDMAAITHEADLPIILRAFRNLIPAEKLGAELLELEEHSGQSFTKLWLDTLDGGDRLRLSMGPLEPGETVLAGQYEIVSRLAAGGQSVTYLAQTNDLKQVVLKEFVLPNRGGIEIRKRALENVEHEAKLLEKLSHERIVKLIDCFVDGQRAYLVLEYIDGKSLRKLVLDEGALDPARAVVLAVAMCDVLEYMHKLAPPIIHRDFTPENLLLRSNGELALIDFNVAEQLETRETKTMVGKHCYVPPEQFRGKATIQSDVYACGCTLYWLLTGLDPEPISASNPQSVRAQISSELNDIVACATAPDTTKRFADTGLMKAQLEKLRISGPGAETSA